jgi:hypothetical protein
VLGGLAALMAVAFGASSAWAEPSTYCVKATKVLTPKKHFTGGFNDKGCTSVNGTHEGKFEKLASFTAPEEAQLKALLKYVNVEAEGVDKKPTVQFSGANVQVINGMGKTTSTNGEGNLVVGYDETNAPTTGPETCIGTGPAGEILQTGSHNLVVGTQSEYTSFGGLVAGRCNGTFGEFASAAGGRYEFAKGNYSSISGGYEGVAEGEYSAISGGYKNAANTKYSSIFGSKLLTTVAEYEAIP